MKDERSSSLFRLNLLHHYCGLPVKKLFYEENETNSVGDCLSQTIRADYDFIYEKLARHNLLDEYKEQLRSFREKGKEERELEELEKLSISWVARGNKPYPSLLAEMEDPPLVLYYRGALAEQGACVSIVGSRKSTIYGRTVARDLGAGLAQAGHTVVSGLARGIDTAAHEGALAADNVTSTIAVLGNGLDQCYPAENCRLQERIAIRGAIISEFPLGFRPRRWNFPRRNRIIAGLSQATVVVEADERSGSLITARLAAEGGRTVLAVPGPVGKSSSKGTNALIREGVPLIRGPQDVLAELGECCTAGAANNQMVEALGGDIGAVFDLVEAGNHTLDELLEACDLEFSRLNRALFELLKRGFIEREEGSLYRIATMAHKS